MKKKYLITDALLLCIVVFTFSCQKNIIHGQEQNEIVSSANNGANGNNEKKIYVSGVVQLYAAVNDPANTGSIVVLAPGTYILNAGYPNAGRLELLENMELLGQQGHSEQVIIDASALPGTSFVPPLNFPAPRTGAIRMGRGSNTIEWLTVKGNSSDQALSVIDADLIWTIGPSHVKIAHSIITGGRTAIDIRNVGAASAGRVLEAEIADNELTENLVQYGQGIIIQNANGATGAIIRANLHGNYIHGNGLGLRVLNNKANNANTDLGKISIQSTADRFDDNGMGFYFVGGLNQGSTGTANGNFISFEAHGTSIQNNRGIPPPDLILVSPCGIYAAGGFSLAAAGASNNELVMNFWGCLISGNQGTADIVAFGAFSPSAAPAGTNNNAEIYLHGISANAIVVATNCVPAEPAGTNVLNIYR